MVNHRVRLLLVCLVVFLLTSCASVPSQIPETMKEACSLYQTVKPEVVRMREYAKDNWQAIPPDVQKTLLKLDGYLPALDKAGMQVCAIAGTVEGLSLNPSHRVQWDDVLSTVVKAATLAAELKSKGVI